MAKHPNEKMADYLAKGTWWLAIGGGLLLGMWELIGRLGYTQ